MMPSSCSRFLAMTPDSDIEYRQPWETKKHHAYRLQFMRQYSGQFSRHTLLCLSDAYANACVIDKFDGCSSVHMEQGNKELSEVAKRILQMIEKNKPVQSGLDENDNPKASETVSGSMNFTATQENCPSLQEGDQATCGSPGEKVIPSHTGSSDESKKDNEISTVQKAKYKNTVHEDFVFEIWPENLGPSLEEVIQFMQSTAFKSSAPLKKAYVLCNNFELKLRLFYTRRKGKTMQQCSMKINSELMSRVERRTSAGAKKAALYLFIAKLMSFSDENRLNSSNLSKPLPCKSPLKSSEQKFTEGLEDPEMNNGNQSGMRTCSTDSEKSDVSSELSEDMNSSDDDFFSTAKVCENSSVISSLRSRGASIAHTQESVTKDTVPALVSPPASLELWKQETSKVVPQATTVEQDSMQSKNQCAPMSLLEELEANLIAEESMKCTTVSSEKLPSLQTTDEKFCELQTKKMKLSDFSSSPSNSSVTYFSAVERMSISNSYDNKESSACKNIQHESRNLDSSQDLFQSMTPLPFPSQQYIRHFVFDKWPEDLGPSTGDVLQFVRKISGKNVSYVEILNAVCGHFKLEVKFDFNYRLEDKMVECFVKINSVLMSMYEGLSEKNAKRLAAKIFVKKLISFLPKGTQSDSYLNKSLSPRNVAVLSSRGRLTSGTEVHKPNYLYKQNNDNISSVGRTGVHEDCIVLDSNDCRYPADHDNHLKSAHNITNVLSHPMASAAHPDVKPAQHLNHVLLPAQHISVQQQGAFCFSKPQQPGKEAIQDPSGVTNIPFIILDYSDLVGSITSMSMFSASAKFSEAKVSYHYEYFTADAESHHVRALMVMNESIRFNAIGVNNAIAKEAVCKEALDCLKNTSYTVKVKYCHDEFTIHPHQLCPPDGKRNVPQFPSDSPLKNEAKCKKGKIHLSIKKSIPYKAQSILQKIFENYVHSDSATHLVFSTEFSAKERAVIMWMGQEFGLKLIHVGENQQNSYIVFQKHGAFDLVKKLLQAGGCTNRYELILPIVQ